MSSSSSSAMGGSHGALAVAAATAMAFSGTLVLLSLCRGKLCLYEADPSPCTPLRSCLSSRGSRGKSRGKGAKRVRFAADVVDNEAAGRAAAAAQRMPANREALYRGMLRDRSMQRAMCSY